MRNYTRFLSAKRDQQMHAGMSMCVCIHGLKLSIWPMRNVGRSVMESKQLSQAFCVGANAHGIVNFGNTSRIQFLELRRYPEMKNKLLWGQNDSYIKVSNLDF